MNDDIKKLIVSKASSEEIKKVAQGAGMRTLREDGVLKVKNGFTTIEEVLRVTAEQ
jgi:type II secretory ATPase GspE/PulE/Tfp pilus assembly ATPase PilB-like protein